MSAHDALVLLSTDSNGVRTLTLNRPQVKDAIDPQLWVALRDETFSQKREPRFTGRWALSRSEKQDA